MAGKQPIVTIDGPSGVGKSTISRKVATALGYTYLDTGAMYRAVALFLERRNVSLTDETAIAETLPDFQLQLLPARDENSDVEVRLAGEDVSKQIRSPEMSMAASKVSALGVVREKLTKMQQQIGRKGRVVAEGRDTGTVVFPGAAYKFYLEATTEERTRRRVLQLREAGQEVDEKEILAATLARDKNDSERSLAPLCKAADATVIDTTGLNIEQVAHQVLCVITPEMP